ncbi:MAG: hypothetical protein RIT45_2693 [Pseudomonadota bacterium]
MSAFGPRWRLLWLTSSYPRGPQDGTARFVAELAEAVAKSGARCRVVTPARAGERAGIAWEGGVEVVRFDFPGREGTGSLVGSRGLPTRLRADPIGFALRLPPYLAAFATAARRARFARAPDHVDATVAHWLVPAGGLLATALPGAPRPLCIAHSSDVDLLARLPGGGALARALAARMPIGATSTLLTERLAALGVDALDLRLGVAVGPAPTTDGRGLCTLSRLVPGKGLEAAIDAAAATPERALTLLGEGPALAALRTRADRRAVRLHAPGAVVGTAKRAALQAHDMLLFLPEADGGFGARDNLPVAVLEALEAGLGVVCSAVGALPALLGDCPAARVLPTGPDGPAPDAVAAAVAALRALPVAERVAAARVAAAPFAMPAALRRLQRALA